MTSVFGRSRLFLGLVGLLSVASVDALAGPTISLKAVAVNGSPIVPVGSIDVAPGDTVTAEIFLTDWTTTFEALLSYQTGISRGAFVGGSRGDIMPVGWDRPLLEADDINCGAKDDPPCPTEFPVCAPLFGGRGICVGASHDPLQGLFIDTDRPDFVFFGLAALPAVDDSGPFRFAAVLVSPTQAPLYSLPPKYAGTVILQVSDDACGSFRLALLASETVVLDQSTVPMNVVRQRLNVTVTSPGSGSGECSCRNIVSSDIPNCTVDAGQPTDPDGSNSQIPTSVTFTFDCEDTTDIANTSNFTRFFSPNFFGPFIASATPNGSDVTLALSGPMLEKRWNCITFDPTGDGVCVGIMPGDVNSDLRSLSFDCGESGEPSCPDGTTALSDIPALADCLNNPGTCSLFQCDIDRSGVCGPRDLLREIDLLIGAGSFATYDFQGIMSSGSVVACPLAP